MSDHEVTLINDSMQEFYVRFAGPSESESIRSLFILERTKSNADACDFLLLLHLSHPALPAPFVGGTWKIHVELQDQYPYRSPSIGFMNKIYHPNIDETSGSVCLDVINQTWSPMFDLVNVFEVFLPQLLRYPNPTDPLNGEAASLLMRDPKSYDAKVKDYVKRYATAGVNGKGTGDGKENGTGQGGEEDEEEEEGSEDEDGEMSDAGSFEADEAADMEL